MQLKKFLFSVIICLIAVLSSAVADTEQKTVASKAYVDSVAETKQDIISGTAGTVVVYDGYDDETGQGLFGEVGVYDGSINFDEDDDADKLVTAGVVHDFAATVETIQIPDDEMVCNNPPTCTLWNLPVDNAKTSLVDAGAFAPLTSSGLVVPISLCAALGDPCTTTALSGSSGRCCDGLYCDPRNNGCAQCYKAGSSCTIATSYRCCSGSCVDNVCTAVLTPGCVQQGETCTETSDCCSGMICLHNKCISIISN